MAESVVTTPQLSAPVGFTWRQRLLYFLLCIYCLLAAIGIPLVGWFYAGLGSGKWQRSADDVGYFLSVGSWHIGHTAVGFYWPGFVLLLVVMAMCVALGWLAVCWCGKHYPPSGAYPMRWPVTHAALLAIVLWRFLISLASQSAELAVGFCPIMIIVLSVVVLAIAFSVGWALNRLLGWSLLLCYIVLALYLPSGGIIINH